MYFLQLFFPVYLNEAKMSLDNAFHFRIDLPTSLKREK